MGVREMHNAIKGVFLVWRAKGTYLYSEGAIKSVIRYLAWAYLKVFKNANKGCFWCVRPNAHTSAPKVPAKVFLNT